MRWRSQAWLVGILLVGGGLRLWNLGGDSFWVDEGWSAYMGHLAKWSEWQVNEHPPLFYAMVAAWMRVADTDGGLRLLPAVFGIGVIPVTYALGRILFDNRVGLVAAAYIAFMSFHVRYSRDLTMYSLEVFLFALVMLALAWIAKQSDSRSCVRGWILYISAATLLAWSQGLGPFYVVIAALFLPIFRADFFRSSVWRYWVIANGIVLLLFLPWIATYIERARAIAGDFWIPRPDAWAPWVQLHVFTVGSIPSISSRLGVGPGEWIWGVPIYALVIGTIVLGVRDRNRVAIGLAMAMIVPIATLYLVSLGLRPVMVSRQMIPVVVPLALLLAYGATRLCSAAGFRIALIAGIGALLLVSSVFHLRYMQKEDWRAAAQYLSQEIRSDDKLIFNTYGAFQGYLMGRYDREGSLGSAHMIFLYPVLKGCVGDVSKCLDESVFGNDVSSGRVWVVESHERYVPNAAQVATWLDARFRKEEMRQYVGVRVWRGTQQPAIIGGS